MNLPGSLRSGDGALGEWLAWLETLSPVEIVLGLERVCEVLERLRPARPGLVIHVGGTNGKGSTVTMLENLFLERGGGVGAYTSPHLLDYNERIRIGGTPADDATILSAFERVEAARRGVPLTYFEFGTLAALAVFEAAGAETVILEVGMGGRLDAVNAVDPDAGIITNVSLDHCEWLGKDVESIAFEKAGILRGGRPFVFGAPTVPQAILDVAAQRGVDLRICGRDYDGSMNPGRPGSWTWSGRRCRFESLKLPALPGAFQLRNAAACLALIEALSLDALLEPRLINAALARLKLPGRCQMLDTDRRWLLDVAHNPDGSRVLCDFLSGVEVAGNTVAVLGLLGDKDLAGIVTPLRDYADGWVAVTAESRRAVPAGKLAAHIANASGKPCLVAEAIVEGLRLAHDQTTGNDLIVVTGSFYTVGPALRWLMREPGAQ